MTVIVQARDPLGTGLHKHKEVTGTLLDDGEFALDVWIKGGSLPPIHVDTEATITREVWKESILAPELEQIKGFDVHPRTIELLETFDDIVTEEEDEEIERTYTLEHIEHLSSILMRVYANGTPPVLYSFEYVTITVATINGNVIDSQVYGMTPPIAGSYVKKIPPAWVYQVTINATVPVVGTYTLELHAERSYDMDTEIGDINVEVAASEKAPLNTKELGELTAEDIHEAIIDEDGEDEDILTPEEIALLFDKAYWTGVLELPAGLSLHLYLKKPFMIHAIKVLGDNNQYIAGISVEVMFPTGLGYTPTPQPPAEVDQEIIRIDVVNNNVGDVDIAEIVAETILHVDASIEEVTINNPESAPVNVEELGQVVLEDVKTFTIDGVPASVSLLANLFDKDYTTTFTVVEGSEYELRFKMPIRAKQLKFMDILGFLGDLSGWTMYYIDVRGAHVPVTQVDEPIVIDDEIVGFGWFKPGIMAFAEAFDEQTS